MALRVDPDVWEKHADFYRLALEGATDDNTAWVLDGASEAALRQALDAAPPREAPRTVVVRACPALRDLTFLERFDALEWVCVLRCPGLEALWDMARTPRLRGLAVTDCARVRNLSALAGAGALEHLLFQQSAWRRATVESLAPLGGLHGLRTLDLACKGVRDKTKLDFRQLYPQLDALTVSPGLRGCFT